MNSKSKMIADCGNLPFDISDLICKFLPLELINKRIACSHYIFGGIQDGESIISNNDHYHYHSPNGKDFISISAGGRICAALHSNGTLEILLNCFTSNYFRWKYYSPDDRFVNITVVNEDIIAIRSDGSIISMKRGEIKKRGFVMFTNGSSNFHEDVIGLKDDGTIEFLEDEEFTHNENLPKGSDYVSIASEWSHILALKTDGTLYSKTSFLTDDFAMISNTPKGNNFIAISVCYDNSAALTDDGIIHLWGRGCDKTREISAKDCIDIAMSDEMIVGLTSNGDIIKYLLPDVMDRYASPIIRSYKFQK